jgi:glutaredoxin-like protein NrdH
MSAKPTEVTVYSTPFCVPCEQLKGWLRARGVEFAVRDLLMDEEAAERVEAAGIRSTPILEIDGKLYVGDDIAPDRLPALLGL